MAETNTTNTNTGAQQEQQAQQTTQAQQSQQASAADIAQSLLAALESRTQRVERSVAKSFSEQYGLSDAEIASILAEAKAKKDAELPEAAKAEIQKQTERANKLLMTAEVKAVGADLGLLDVDTAMLLMDTGNVKVEENGTVTGVREALEALQTAKPFLFSKKPDGGQQAAQQTQTGARVSTGASLAGGQTYTSKAEIMKIKDPVARQKAIAENWGLFQN